MTPRDRLRDELARMCGYPNYATAHDAVRQQIDLDVENVNLDKIRFLGGSK
jgi:hypothetical protein